MLCEAPPTSLHDSDPERDAFMMDLENKILEKAYREPLFKAAHYAPKGRKRWQIPEWAELIKKNVYPHHSDVDFQEYIDFCEAGGGHEWFQED